MLKRERRDLRAAEALEHRSHHSGGLLQVQQGWLCVSVLFAKADDLTACDILRCVCDRQDLNRLVPG